MPGRTLNVAVVGAGVVGLAAAVRLLEAGHRVTVIAARRTPGTTSDRSGAAFTPYGTADNTRLVGWIGEGFRSLTQLAAEAPESGVRVTGMRDYMYTPGVKPPWWAGVVGGFEVLPGPKGFSAVFQARLPMMDMTRYPKWLDARVASLGGVFVEQKLGSLKELDGRGFDVAVNCAGLGSRELVPDPAMTPMKGQILHCRNTLGLDASLHDEPREGHGVTYIFAFPNHVVLGGTFEPGVESDATEDAAIRGMVERCRELLRVDGHPRWEELGREELKRTAGLRPARVVGGNSEAIRLELERRGGGVPLVHNYGHGRSGVTMSWGCARAVCELIGSL